MDTQVLLQRYKPIVMIVDDIPENLQVLGSNLDIAGYETAFATNGRDAIEAIKELMPDLVLLDISMPDMDGFEVCRHLKGNARTAGIPVIFLTAHTDVENIIRGFQSGAADYIAKPFQQAELLARVSVHLELCFTRRQLTEQNYFLTELNREKNELLGIAAHDLKNPLQGVALAAGNGKKFAQRENAPGSEKQFATIEKSVEKMLDIINTLLDAKAIESGSLEFHREKIFVFEIQKELVNEFASLYGSKHIGLHFAEKDETLAIYADRLRTMEILDNLLSNALKFSTPGTNVWISMSPITRDFSNFVRFEVRDEGPGISDEDKQKLFHRFARLSARPTGGESSTGLGLSIAKKLVEMMGGVIYCESELNVGTTFIVELPSIH